MKYTIDQIQAATGDNLSKMAGEVLQKPTGCFSCSNIKTPVRGVYNCLSNVSVNNPWGYVRDKDLCLDAKAKLIPVTGPKAWTEAMKWRDWAVKEYGLKHFHYQLEQDYRANLTLASDYSQYGFNLWLIEAQPEDYIKAAMICKIKAEGGK